MPKEVFTKKEVAEYFSVTERTIEIWVSKGILRPMDLGSHTVRFSAEELERLRKSTRKETE